jgi:hypothetical protein
LKIYENELEEEEEADVSGSIFHTRTSVWGPYLECNSLIVSWGENALNRRYERKLFSHFMSSRVSRKFRGFSYN